MTAPCLIGLDLTKHVKSVFVVTRSHGDQLTIPEGKMESLTSESNLLEKLASKRIEPDYESLDTSDINQVLEISPKRNLHRNLEVTRDSGSPPIATKVPVSKFVGEI